ncbi:hypothetical protein HYU11_04935 [Candidatus Woesearchaeota archaeon]|nr:hypothetical protein [Candidatus Woesearchaeota archaeon]
MILNEGEIRVLNLYCRGCNQAETARRLRLSKQTAKAHIYNARKRNGYPGLEDMIKSLEEKGIRMAPEFGMWAPISDMAASVLMYAGNGLVNKEIARKLHIPLEEVKDTFSCLYDSFGLYKNNGRCYMRNAAIAIYIEYCRGQTA